MRTIFIKIALLVVLIASICTVNAQKLPAIQKDNIRAPKNIKVDGKATEWSNKFQAYNKATDVFYSIANDNNNLYLIVQATERDIITKIVNGRITVTLNKSGQKDDKNAVIVSYPVINRSDKPSLNLKNKPEFIAGNAVALKAVDSFMNANNTRMTTAAKMIKVTGVTGLDTLISVYNQDGIKAAGLFDNQAAYTCEFAIALKHLGLSANNQTKFSYNIKLNGVAMDDVPGINITRSENGTITAININKADTPRNMDMMTAATDFWGEYTLAK